MVLAAFGATAGPVAPRNPPPPSPLPEDELLTAINEARGGRATASIDTLEDLLRRQPNFRLAQLVYADMLAARSGIRGIMADDEDPRIRELFEEAQLRIEQSNFSPPTGTVPDTVLQLSREYPYLVLMDLPRARLHLLRNNDGRLQAIGSRYAGIGRGGYGKQAEGDLRTPVGIYHVTGWMGDDALPELYGIGALPLNYPNLWDKFKAKTGYGIWLHGVPRATYVRAPRSSEGCVTMANDDLLWLKPYVVNSRAPVVLADKVEWIPDSKARAERDAFAERIEAWRKAWVSKDTDAYLAYYGDTFSTAGMNKVKFSEHKRRVNKGKKSIGVKLSDLSLFRYPGEPMFLAEFTLDYKSDNFQFVAKKEQYWRQDAKGEWKIFREENR
ncbi:MAG TPA: L,D-transpeptidase family protein [Nevskiaceae bacterium]|nr:L,D-transpeptidase family protein [Nevskiaceae bacterium]